MHGPPDPEKTNPLTPDSLAAEGAGDGDRNLSERLGRYGTGKSRSYQMAGHCVAHGEPKLGNRLYRCASFLHFREWLDHGGKMTLSKGHFCQIPLLCPVCAIRRGGKMLRRYVERAKFIARTHELFLVTLTVKNGEDLQERYLHLKHAVKRLRIRGRDGYGAFARADGALWSTEFTNKGNGWHPHVHMVWALPRGTAFTSLDDIISWGDGSQLAMDWKAITGDSHIVHVAPIKASDEEALVSAFCEVLKYALKFSGLSLEDNLHAYKSLKGQRLISSCGIWWGLDLPEDAKLEDDPLDGPYIEHIYRYAGSQGYQLEDVFAVENNSLHIPSGTSTLQPTEHS